MCFQSSIYTLLTAHFPFPPEENCGNALSLRILRFRDFETQEWCFFRKSPWFVSRKSDNDRRESCGSGARLEFMNISTFFFKREKEKDEFAL